MAQEAQLDFLEIVGPDGNVVSSAQWPARFGYPERRGKRMRSRRFSSAKTCPTAPLRWGSLRCALCAKREHGECGWWAASAWIRAFSPICPLRRE